MPLSVPAEDLVPGLLRHRQGLAGDGGLVDLAGPLKDAAIGPDPLAGTDQDGVADSEVLGGHCLLAPVVGQTGGGGGGEVEQAADRVLGTSGGQRLQRAGGRENDDQQGTVHHLPDRRRTERGHDHQQIHIQGLLPQRLQAGDRPASQPPVT